MVYDSEITHNENELEVTERGHHHDDDCQSVDGEEGLRVCLMKPARGGMNCSCCCYSCSANDEFGGHHRE